MFAWKVVKYAKSNAAVISTGTKTLGVGMGQTSRIGAVELALKRAGEHAEGSMMHSSHIVTQLMQQLRRGYQLLLLPVVQFVITSLSPLLMKLESCWFGLVFERFFTNLQS